MADRNASDSERDDAAARATLKQELEALYALMQTPAIEAATELGFHASGREMGLAALGCARESARGKA